MFGQRLRLARKKSGYTQERLADEVNITKQAVSKYEKEKMLPDPEVLAKISRALGVSLHYLMRRQVMGIESVEFRKSSGTRQRDRALAEVLVTETVEKYINIMSILDMELSVDSVASVRGDIASLDDAEQCAVKLRRLWKLGNDPVPSVSELLEAKGFKLVMADMPDSIHALTCNVKLRDGSVDRQVIMVGKGGGVERRRFNLAHELGHKVILQVGDKSSGRELERAVDRFAGAFLVPKEHLLQLAGDNRHGISYGELVRLKHIYGVSAAAMLMRLKQTGILPEHYVDALFRDSEVRKWRRKEPAPVGGDDFREQPQMFELLVWRALSEQLMHPIRAASLMNVSLAEVEQQIRKAQ